MDFSGRVGWRLLSANNRDLGRAAVAYPDSESCLGAVRHLRRRLPDAMVVTSRDRLEYWTWSLRLDGTDVAMSSRHYQRRVQCEYASRLFLSLVLEAELTDSPPIGQP